MKKRNRVLKADAIQNMKLCWQVTCLHHSKSAYGESRFRYCTTNLYVYHFRPVVLRAKQGKKVKTKRTE